MRIICLFLLFACDFYAIGKPMQPVQHEETYANITTLRFVHALWRHGDRSPFLTFPKRNTSMTWPEGHGELTKLGMRQQYKLGSYLRKRYVESGFLSRDYNSTEIYVHSTDFNRTIMSALSNLAAMYPPIDQWNEGLMWQPIPVHSKPRMDDPVAWPERPCPIADHIFFNETLKSDSVKQLHNENNEFLEFLSKHTGLNFSSDNWLFYIGNVYDPLLCDFMHNRTWPTWVTRDIFNKIVSLNDEFHLLYVKVPQLLRLKAGLLTAEIAGRLEQKAKSPSSLPTLKYYAYSAHDTTMLTQLATYGAYDGTVPAYASALFYELHENSPGKFTVEIWYIKDQGDTPPSRIAVQGCNGESCDLDIFLAIAKDHALTESDYYEGCGLKKYQEPVSRSAWTSIK